MVPDENNGAEGRNGEGPGDRPDRPPGPHRPGPQDAFWVGVLVLIVAVLVLVALLSQVDMDTGGPTYEDWNTVWH